MAKDEEEEEQVGNPRRRRFVHKNIEGKKISLLALI